ncbi:MAG: hypothetical protein Q8P40_14250 [Nitrospirota bacterium]|nr:hypothetical protein [Nitrospirota bacterium]
MPDLTATERLERARKSIVIAEERLSTIKKRLPELNSELEELRVVNEIQGYKGRTIERTQAEIETLQKEKDTLEQTIVALQKKLPELEKEARIEIAEKNTVKEYEESLTALSDLIGEVPTIDELREAVKKIQGFAESLENRQKKFFALSQGLNQTLIKENLPSVGHVDIKTLRANAGNLNYNEILALSDGLIDLSDELNSLQYFLFKTSTATLVVTEPPLPHIEENCACGKHRREYKPREGWFLWEYQQDVQYFGKWEWILIEKESGFKNKPKFLCERKQPALHKNKPELRPSDIPGQMVYNNEVKGIRDPDKSITPVEDGL